ncbi:MULTISPECIES: 6-phosphofructokinase [Anaerococcus]|uniref:ATP-dependent 6-phosphofructokinase n=3 Tax=Anaerococcus TaxID=165779 RepID=C7HTE7_9FIRM|nr:MULTISPECIES: 6-phosphofructokinase [Anaerococcus]EEU13025.1 6-phosphofructokinase [Anaerococcus vaginalis ATCC 51170]MBS4889509.1 6-phosphofructokinase [Anaerococcus vaginalis]MBS6921350.1 6-phosphofructokinase [Anaerococcus vaginalis]MDD7767214.1 6-phosphofructokinase [Anaerococcus vaginalis]MDU0946252.1 6-phosphofructokinase [Anaerococcus vaginalis]
MKTIGILTSGGDAPGMNSAIRAAVRTALNNGMRVKGIRNGYDGLMKGDIYEMNVSSVADIIHKGGTILGTARSTEFKNAEGQKRGAQILKDYGIEGLIVIGGDGSFKGAKALSDLGIKTIGIPGTIDNDMGYTDFTIGFFTAIETVTDAIGKLRDTSSSHGRAVVIEVMGRNCGDLALFSGLAGGAESIIVPEHKFSIDEIVEKVNHGRKRGKLHHLIVLAEGVGNPYTVAKEVEERSGVETKVTVLGHVQRGGSPSSADRLLGSIMGATAAELLNEEKTNIALGYTNGKINQVSIDEAVSMNSDFNEDLYRLANKLSK